MEMPKGTEGGEAAADLIGNAIHAMRIATGKIEGD
jgi:hypothetical protein